MEEKQKEAIRQIRASLKYGDRKIITRIVGCSPELVKKVLAGERNHRKGKGKKVLEVARKIIDARALLEALGERW